MKKLTYVMRINKPTNMVFEKIQDKAIYPNWAKAWGEGMTFEGEWSENKHISFFDTSGSGTKVVVKEIVPNESIKMEHVAMVQQGNVEVTELDETMKKWIGSKEDYYFKKIDENETELEVVVETDEVFEEMMNAWDRALELFKKSCEKENLT